jgi:hypothetical protein
MLRNPIYKGNIVVPELGDEEEQEVIGIHEAIISRELFDKVQTVLARILEKNASRIEKVNYRDELPLEDYFNVLHVIPLGRAAVQN